MRATASKWSKISSLLNTPPAGDVTADVIREHRSLVLKMRIIDPHHHFTRASPEFNLPPPFLAFFGTDIFFKTDYLLQDYLKHAEGVNLVKSVWVETGSPDALWIQQIADNNPKGIPHGIVGGVDLSSPTAEETLKNHKQLKNIRGVRHSTAFHPDPNIASFCKEDLMTSKNWQEGFSLLQKYDLSFDAWLYSHQLGQLISLAKQFPTTKIILDHLGTPVLPNSKDQAKEQEEEQELERVLTAWMKDLRELEKCPNVYVKLSGLGMPIVGLDLMNPDTKKPTDDINLIVNRLRPFIMFAIDLFGVERCMFASNFQVDSVGCSYSDLWTSFSIITASLAPEQRESLFSKTAETVYRL